LAGTDTDWDICDIELLDTGTDGVEDAGDSNAAAAVDDDDDDGVTVGLGVGADTSPGPCPEGG